MPRTFLQFMVCVCVTCALIVTVGTEASAASKTTTRQAQKAESGTSGKQAVKQKSAKTKATGKKSAKRSPVSEFGECEAGESAAAVMAASQSKQSTKIAKTSETATATQLTRLGNLRMPVDGDVSSPFGLRRIPKGRGSKVHKGIDIRASVGDPVIAAGSGVVVFSGAKRGYGKVMEIDHGNGLLTRYAHLGVCSLPEGRQVKAGEVIGKVGRTGRITGINLHFETVVNGRFMDPMPFLGSSFAQSADRYGDSDTARN